VHDVRSGIPAVMWYVVVVGALLNLSIVWLFDMRLITQLFLGGDARLLHGHDDLSDRRNG